MTQIIRSEFNPSEVTRLLMLGTLSSLVYSAIDNVKSFVTDSLIARMAENRDSRSGLLANHWAPWMILRVM